jgi:hypothetical protein
MAKRKDKKNKNKMSQAKSKNSTSKNSTTSTTKTAMSTTNHSPEFGWQGYSLDRYAHDLVFQRKDLENEVLNQVHKMRSTVAFGLERFWGEQHRLDGEKAAYWRAMWHTLATILQDAGIALPNDATNLWEFNQDHRKIAIAILTQLCDCAIWWTQRYKS